MTLESRFWNKVSATPTEKGCLPWTAYRNRAGYGLLYSEGQKKQLFAHRVAWFVYYGAWPTHFVLHRCDNPPCVAKGHLFEGTLLDNIADRYQKGRCAHPIGLKNGRAVLNERDVLEIRDLWPTMTLCAIGELYGIKKSCVHLVVKRKLWGHI